MQGFPATTIGLHVLTFLTYPFARVLTLYSSKDGDRTSAIIENGNDHEQ